MVAAMPHNIHTIPHTTSSHTGTSHTRPMRHLGEGERSYERVIKREQTNFKREFGLIIVGALIFLASFLWKDFFTDIQEVYFPRRKGLLARGLYIAVVTTILITIAVHIKNAVSPGEQIAFDDSPINDGNHE